MSVDVKEIYKVMDVEMIMENFPIHTTYGVYILTSSKYGVDVVCCRKKRTENKKSPTHAKIS